MKEAQMTNSKSNSRPFGHTTHGRNCGSASTTTGPIPHASRSRWRWGLALAGGLAAACVAAVFFRGEAACAFNGANHRSGIRPASPVAVEDAGLTRLAYRRALARSPEDLDALLDKDAMAAQKPNPELVRICAFTRSDAALQALIGED